MELLSQAFGSAPTEPSSVDPQEEPILVEITDASTTTENVGFILDACQSIFFNFLIYSVLQLTSYHARYFLKNTYARVGA